MNGSLKKISRVPKKQKEILETVSIKSDEFQTEIYSYFLKSYCKTKLSEDRFIFENAWNINSTEAEDRFMKRRQAMRKENNQISESVGFLYVKSDQDLLEIINSGCVYVGNVCDSWLGTGSMGISVCQHADVYHPGSNVTGIPKSGYIVIVKYIKGKINFVQPDYICPMEPQPQFDCHISKTKILNDNCTLSRAFHLTQVFIYEYTEDGEIEKHPTQILPISVVKFHWNGDPLFSHQSGTKIKHVQRYLTKTVIPEFHPSVISPIKPLKHKRPSRFTEIDTSIHSKDSTFNLPCQLGFNKHFSDVKIVSTVYMYMTNPTVFPQLYNCNWTITDLIQTIEFEKELKLFQFYLQDKISNSSTDLLNPLSNDIIISKSAPTFLALSEGKINPFLLSNDTAIPKFITYMRMVPDSSKQSKEHTLKLIDHLNNSKTIARISLGQIDVQYRTILFIFPDGKLSQKLGIPAVKDNVKCYFHGLIFHFQHPEFTLCHLTENSFEEKSIYFNCLSIYKKQGIHAKLHDFNLATPKSIIQLDVIKQTCIAQAVMQKELFHKLLRLNNIHTNNSIYPPIMFEKLALENVCNDNVESSNVLTNSYVVPIDLSPNKFLQKKSKSKERKSEKRKVSENKCKDLKVKLYKILKNSSTENEHIANEESMSNKENCNNKNEQDSDSISMSNNSADDVSMTSILDDLLPINQKLSLDDVESHGNLREITFINEYFCKIENSKKIFFIDKSHIRPMKHIKVCKKMWTLDRTLFRKVKHVPGISVYL